MLLGYLLQQTVLIFVHHLPRTCGALVGWVELALRAVVKAIRSCILRRRLIPVILRCEQRSNT